MRGLKVTLHDDSRISLLREHYKQEILSLQANKNTTSFASELWLAILATQETHLGDSLVKEPAIDFRSNLVCCCYKTRGYYNRNKKRGHRACFHATMLTNTVIKVTSDDPRAQQISSIIFKCGVLRHAEFDFDCLFIYVPEKL